MRIFVVCVDPGIPVDGTKGASVHLRSLVGALDHAGHEVTLFTEAGLPEPDSWPLPVPVRRVHPGRSLLEEVRSAGVPDVVYERYSLGREDGLWAARALGVPFALEVNAPLVVEARRHRPQSLRPHHGEVERRLFHEADVVLAVSEALRVHVERLRGTERGTVVLRNGFNAAHFPNPSTLERPVLAFLGHPKPWHGPDRLPEILAEVRARGHKARLLLIGGGVGADRVLAAAETSGVRHAVEVTGPLPAAAAARRLVEASVAVAPYPPDPSFYFCPLKVIEYMAAGLPVVAPAQGDIPEIVGDAGILVPPGDDEAFTEAVERLLDAPGLRHLLGARGRLRAFDRFTWDAVAGRLVRTVTPLMKDVVA
jgi:glycosyltransferase involved in cell wall biosynthesis